MLDVSVDVKLMLDASVDINVCLTTWLILMLDIVV